MKNVRKGFTLIELLVVIAIIGILSAVVLASLNSARAKGADASIKANLSGIRAQGELNYDTLNCYGSGTCAAAAIAPGPTCAGAGTIFADPNVAAAIAAAKAAGSTLGACASSANQTAYAVAVQLKSNSLAGWCVDSTGKSKQITLATADQLGLNAEVSAAGACVE